MSWPFNYSLSSIHTHKNNRPHKTFQQANFCSCDFSFIFHEIAYPFKRIFEYNDSFLSSPYHIFHQMTLFSNDVENNCPVWWILCLLYISRWISEYIQRFEVCNSLHGLKKKKPQYQYNSAVQYHSESNGELLNIHLPSKSQAAVKSQAWLRLYIKHTDV